MQLLTMLKTTGALRRITGYITKRCNAKTLGTLEF